MRIQIKINKIKRKNKVQYKCVKTNNQIIKKVMQIRPYNKKKSIMSLKTNKLIWKNSECFMD